MCDIICINKLSLDLLTYVLYVLLQRLKRSWWINFGWRNGSHIICCGFPSYHDFTHGCWIFSPNWVRLGSVQYSEKLDNEQKWVNSFSHSFRAHWPIINLTMFMLCEASPKKVTFKCGSLLLSLRVIINGDAENAQNLEGPKSKKISSVNGHLYLLFFAAIKHFFS